jgi:hypothetical protein
MSVPTSNRLTHVELPWVNIGLRWFKQNPLRSVHRATYAPDSCEGLVELHELTWNLQIEFANC